VTRNVLDVLRRTKGCAGAGSFAAKACGASTSASGKPRLRAEGGPLGGRHGSPPRVRRGLPDQWPQRDGRRHRHRLRREATRQRRLEAAAPSERPTPAGSTLARGRRPARHEHHELGSVVARNRVLRHRRAVDGDGKLIPVPRLPAHVQAAISSVKVRTTPEKDRSSSTSCRTRSAR
jgi:hypothetical protein